MTDHTPPDDRPTGPAFGAHPDIDELSAYAAGELLGGDAVRVAEHTATCADCAGDLAALAEAGRALADLAPVTMPADVAARLDDRLRRERMQPVGAAGRAPQRRRSVPTWAGVAAGVAALALGGGVLVSLLGQGSDDSATSAESGGRPAAGAVTSALAAADVVVRESGTDYTTTGETFQAQVRSALLTAASTDDEGAPAAPTPAASAAPSAVASASESSSAMPSEAATVTASASGGTTESAAPTADASAGGPDLPDESASPGAGETVTKSGSAARLQARLRDLGNDPERRERCVQALTGGEPATLVSIDLATFRGRPAATFVFRGDDPDTLAVYVVRPECGASDADPLLHFENVPTG